MARITVNGEMVHFAARMYIHPDRWQPKDYRTAGKTEKHVTDKQKMGRRGSFSSLVRETLDKVVKIWASTRK